MLPLRHLLYSERDVLSAARLVFKTNKQNNGTTDLSSQFRHHISVVVISVCFAFAVKKKWKEPAEIHPDRYNTLPFQLVCFFFSSFPGSSLRVKAVILGTHWCFFGLFLCIYFIVDISDCFSPTRSAVFFCSQDSPISKQTDVSISTAQGWLWCAACLPACRRVNSNSNSSVLLSSVCSSCCAGCQNGSLLPQKRWKAIHFSVCRNWWIHFEIQFSHAGGDEPNAVSVSLDATADLISHLLSTLNHLVWVPGEKMQFLLVNLLFCLSVFDNCTLIILSVPCNWPFFVVPSIRLMTSWYFCWLCRYPATRRRLKEQDPCVLIYLSVPGLKPVYLIKGMSEELWQP